MGECGVSVMTDFLGGKYSLQTMPDMVFEILCAQISADYTAIIRSEILSELPDDYEIGIREVRLLLMVDYHPEIISSASAILSTNCM